MPSVEIQALSVANHEIASHTITHADLTKLSAKELVHELDGSKTIL